MRPIFIALFCLRPYFTQFSTAFISIVTFVATLLHFIEKENREDGVKMAES
jgi:hypothetical protein